MLSNLGKKAQAVLIIDSIVLLESGELDSTYIAELDKKAELMLSNEGMTAEIYGAALPGESLDMARKRALKAYNYMIDKAINEKRLTANYPGKDAIDGKKETVEGGPFVAKYEQTIHFGTNSKLVTEYSRGKLGAFLDFMKDKPNAKVYLSGHSDHIGNEKYNLELSKKRVDSVEEYLRSQGIKQNIRKEYFGESTPRVSMEDVQSDPKKLILNRRVNIVVF
jgi:outer membrane protein OmpA-like peptidoglycan-associated protein